MIRYTIKVMLHLLYIVGIPFMALVDWAMGNGTFSYIWHVKYAWNSGVLLFNE